MITVETSRGDEIEHGDRLLVPIGKSLRVSFSHLPGGIVWTRPLGVEVHEAGEERFLPVHDRTRQLQWLLLCAGMAGGLLLHLVRARRRRRRCRSFWR
ncbi:MAG TPA: hypothetical protein VGK70_02875 [Thermoanaerobaculia bacterium]